MAPIWRALRRASCLHFADFPRRGRRRPFDWRLALEKEYESILGWIAAALLLELYEEFLWAPPGHQWKARVGAVLLGLIGLTAAAMYLSKHRRTRW